MEESKKRHQKTPADDGKLNILQDPDLATVSNDFDTIA